MMKHRFLLTFLLLGLVLVGCDSEEAGETSDGYFYANVFMDAPLDGSTIAFAPYKVVFHAAIEGYVLTEFEININGVFEARVSTDSYGGNRSLWFGEYEWAPPAPGEYYISVAPVVDGDLIGGYLGAVTVNVAERGAVVVTDTPIVVEEAAADGSYAFIGPTFDTTVFYNGSCQPNEIKAYMQSNYTESHDVVLFYRLADAESSERGEWDGKIMDPIGDGYYLATVASSDLVDAGKFANTYFQSQVVILTEDGDELHRTSVLADQVFLGQCGRAVPPTVTAPAGGRVTPTPFRVVFPTATPRGGG